MAAIFAVSRRDGVQEQRPAAQADTEDWPSLTAATSSSSNPQLPVAGGGVAECPATHSVTERRPSDSGVPTSAAERLEAGAPGAHPPAGGSRADDGPLNSGEGIREELDWDSLVITGSQSEGNAGVSPAIHQAERCGLPLM